jgi:SH3-like domain-containing protein
MRAGTVVVALGLLLGAPALGQVRPVARPADLAIPPPEERVLPASSAEAAAPEEAEAPAPVGSVTGLPLPRFVSLKRGEGNARRGPSLDQRIDWVFVRTGMPLRITAEYGHWRRVEDREGLGGWVHYSLLSGARTVIVDRDMLPLRAREDDRSPEVARLQAGVIAEVEACSLDWCRLSAGGFGGWAPKTALWGVGAGEVLD